MRFILRAILFGILFGAFVFFIPIHFFFFPILFFFIALRVFFRPWRWRHRFGYGPHRFGPWAGYYRGYDSMNENLTPVMPIDGFGEGRRSRNSKGENRNINIQ